MIKGKKKSPTGYARDFLRTNPAEQLRIIYQFMLPLQTVPNELCDVHQTKLHIEIKWKRISTTTDTHAIVATYFDKARLFIIITPESGG